ncbi:similar to Saccharomyces cerevisiae YGR258C RAD2 Single-stranded DNA endonuclease, cleaves single-stranded DNA during nucleotide excision repair to excise damaged DNA [Maudiozyma saulgeensis]|uniref:Similar to Saccharomyces cerevisiae YGR258C RAD2 Single-stranded DNA endonuclease, cleaves single-stranded DNA during nucleotide excision repair to excise damaged DNA n=1 Tax=Maudiozyma saulgeensis TaxID=1789683 RepID=A0A1X7R9P5_9SACH|nr:similar to Saccharomyces cerevisiae YGR258C RAD2 Single-stranded DNA endonuclease, cleaves single-stranded DNA during nucleotide excision repair to excise damaged DNA [Kazachstania saulgeensis]
MGVHSFWDIVGPTARPVKLESLKDKKMAVDASIWIYQFIKAMRDSEGNAIKNSHITGFFRRICKLLYFGIKPVFVFDGGVPALKRDTIKQRNEVKQGKRDSAQRTARKLLALQMHKNSGNSKNNEQKKDTKTSDLVFRPQDDWDLPNIEGFKVSRKDTRVNLNYEEEKKKRKRESLVMEDTIDNLDLDSIDPTSEAFEELPKNLQYQLLSNLRLKSRLRMGYSKEQLENVFPDSLDFSKFQIDMVKRRNYYTQRIINMTGYHDGGASKLNDEIVNRISGQKNREYKITKTENGWTLGLGEYDGSEAKKAILLDAESQIPENNKTISNHLMGRSSGLNGNEDRDIKKKEDDDEDDDDDDWEDVALAPTVVKDTFDYSLKAGRLPELDKTSQIVGSQAFLDKIPIEQSPVSRDRPTASYKVKVADEDDVSSEDGDYDEYTKQFEEIEMMEAFQKSKLEQFRREKLAKEQQEKLEKKQEQQKITKETLKQHQNNLDKGKDNQNFHKETEGEQNLRIILDRSNNSTVLNGNSFLFGGPSISNEHNEEAIDEPVVENTIPETPSWFGNIDRVDTVSEPNVSNPFANTNFVEDKAEPINGSEKMRDNRQYELVMGANAQYLVDEQMKLQDKSHVALNIVTEKDNKLSDNIISISDTSDSEITQEISNSADKAIVDNNSSSDNSGNISNIFANSVQNDKAKPTIFEYEFSEDEENDLADNIRQEEKDFDTFRNVDLLHNYQPNKEVADTAFLEDELFKQQVKEKRDSDEVTPDMVTDIQDMLSQFGIPFITAPMEAEAQCAELLQLNLVDGVITDDSDVFLFGGSKIYRNMFHDRKYVEFYDSERITIDLGLDRRNMIDLALLLGSDYTTGLKGMGPVSSMEVIAEFGDLTKFKQWYEEGQFDSEKLSKENKFEKDLRKRMVKNDILLDSNFPSELVVDAYMNPEVDHDTTPFVWGYPAIDMLRNFLEDHLGWTQEKTDEILLPLMKDINSRKKNKQRSITTFFPTEYITNQQVASGGKRILTATSKLKKRKTKK